MFTLKGLFGWVWVYYRCEATVLSCHTSRWEVHVMCRRCIVLLLDCAQHASFVLLASCPILFASSTKVDAPLDQVSLSLCWELADCHLSVAGTSQDTGSPLRAGHVTQLSVLNALQTSPIAVLLSIWKACGNTHVLAALRGDSQAFLRFQMRTSPIQPLP